jgi:hypothetical protein
MPWPPDECKLAREGLAAEEKFLQRLQTPPITPSKREMIAIWEGIVKGTQQAIAKNCGGPK